MMVSPIDHDPAPDSDALEASSVHAGSRLDGAHDCVVGLAGLLNQCLRLLDDLQMSQAAAHLSAAIEALPGPAAVLPRGFQDLMN